MFRNNPGVSGIYISAAFAGTLSTVSSGINSMSTCFVTDFLQRNDQKLFKKTLSDATTNFLGKLFVVIFGFLCIGFRRDSEIYLWFINFESFRHIRRRHSPGTVESSITRIDMAHLNYISYYT